MNKGDFRWDGGKRAYYLEKPVGVNRGSGGTLTTERLADWVVEWCGQGNRREEDVHCTIVEREAQMLLDAYGPPPVEINLPLRNNLIVKELGELA